MKPHSCTICGEDNPEQFYANRKSKCKRCCSDAVKAVYHNSDKVDHNNRSKRWQQEHLFEHRLKACKARCRKNGREITITVQTLMNPCLL